MIYADDLCVISLSSSGLQSLLNICTDYCQLHDLTFNAKKSVCMFFRSSVNKQCGLANILISGTMCEFANKVKYVSVMINSSLKTTIDLKRQTRNFYSRDNLLIRNFRYYTDNVKGYLFQSYCTRAVTINRFESIQINSSSQPINRFKILNRFTETIHYFYFFNGIVARKCQQIDFYQT